MGHRGECPAAAQEPAFVQRLRRARRPVRSSGNASFRVRSPLGHGGLFRVPDATGELPELRRHGGEGALGRRKLPSDHIVPLVPGGVGQTPVVAGGGHGVPHELAERVPVGAARGLLGNCTPGVGSDWCHRDRRDRLAKGTQVPDAGVPDRRGLQAAVVDREGTDGSELAAVLRAAAEKCRLGNWLCLQRPVETVSERDCAVRRPCGACSRPVSPDDSLQQGAGRDSGGRSAATATNRCSSIRGGAS